MEGTECFRSGAIPCGDAALTLPTYEYTHGSVTTPEGQRIMRDINRWHIEEFAYLIAKLEAMPEGDGTLLDHTLLTLVHEHAEANNHKNSGLAMVVAGGLPNLKTGSRDMARSQFQTALQ